MNKSLLEKLLDFYHITYEEYLSLVRDVSLDTFAEGHQFDDIDKAVNLVKETMNNNGKIIIYGDYDADGIMGTSILIKMFSYLDYVADYYIPSRYLEGYGLTLKHAQEYVENGYSLLIAVDNGISAFEPIEYLHNHGVKVLVLDHHQVQEEIPLADVIIHPTYSHFSLEASSGAFTAFMFSCALLGRKDKYLATLASISLISDMMPLKNFNRDLLRICTENYKVGEFLPIDLLADKEGFNYEIIGMKIAPRINSIGRIIEDNSVNEIVRFFTSDDQGFILNYFSYILQTNELRKNLSKEMVGESFDFDNSHAIVVLGDYKEGIIGLIANNLMNKYHVPTIVFTKSLDGTYKGSARSPEGFDIVKAFNELSPHLLTFGGHAMAGGCSIKAEKYEEFKKAFISLAESTPMEYVEHPTIDIGFNDFNMENYELINSFSPFGEGWSAPSFKLKHVKTSVLTYSKDSNHILTMVGRNLKIVGFNFPKKEIEKNMFINIIGGFKKTYYRSVATLEFRISKIEACDN